MYELNPGEKSPGFFTILSFLGGSHMDKTKRQITKIAREANKLVIRTMKDDGIESGEMAMDFGENGGEDHA